MRSLTALVIAPHEIAGLADAVDEVLVAGAETLGDEELPDFPDDEHAVTETASIVDRAATAIPRLGATVQRLLRRGIG